MENGKCFLLWYIKKRPVKARGFDWEEVAGWLRETKRERHVSMYGW